MVVKKIIDLLFYPLEKFLQCVGSVLNTCPSPEEIKKLKKSPINRSTYPKSTQKNKPKPRIKKRIHPQGSINTESKIFNKPRK
jgi:hypothetical protein